MNSTMIIDNYTFLFGLLSFIFVLLNIYSFNFNYIHIYIEGLCNGNFTKKKSRKHKCDD
jgi:hypothetical protein